MADFTLNLCTILHAIKSRGLTEIYLCNFNNLELFFKAPRSFDGLKDNILFIRTMEPKKRALRYLLNEF